MLIGSHELIASMYPGFAQWLAVREQLDPEGRFDSPFARRVGITRAEFSQAIRG